MKTPRVIRRQSLRVRITLAFVATGVLLAGALSVATFLAVRSFLLQQRISAATDESVVALQLSQDFFRRGGTEPDQLVARLQLRGNFESVVTTGEDFFPSTLSLTPIAIPPALHAVVDDEQLGYQFARVGSSRSLIFGAPLPPEGTDIFLFFGLGDLDNTLSVLLRVLLVAGLAVVLVAGVLAQRVAGRLLRPLRDVSDAAQRVAEGLLETRVPPATRDEVGMLASSFNEMASAFEDMLSRERRFVANVSHELRTPLATLRTASELLESHREDVPPATREAVDLISEDVANLRRLVEELMEVSEVDAGRAILRWEDVDLRSLARAVVAKMRRDAAVSGDSVSTVADKARLERILSNLIDNAYEHGGGDVRIDVGRDDGTGIIQVSDRGGGIPLDDLPHLFDRFYKADTSRSRDHGGIGLGLAIAMENARLLGGTITVSSEPQTGTCFSVRIPIRGDAPEGRDA